MFKKIKRWQSPRYRKAAEGQPCTMRLPCCNGNPETTVLAHRNGAGVAMKTDDFDAADMCFECHKAFDGAWPYLLIYKEEEFCRARFETIVNRVRRGVLK